jgi:alpha-glucosidase (family GH31 glycosyl hydrolase)
MNAHVPYMEILLGPNRTPWNPPFTTGANATPPLLTTIFTKWTQEHHDMIPYTRSLLRHATQYGMPVVRAMPLVYPDDPVVADMSNQYMYGDALLVAPVITQSATSRSVYLPAGNWYNYNDKLTRIAGGQTITAAAPLDVIPRYVKAGAIIPRGDIIKSNNNWTPNWAPSLHIEFFPEAGITSSFNYWNGSAFRPIIGTRNGSVVTLKFSNLGTDGKVEMYGIAAAPATVTRNGQTLSNGADFQYDAASQKLTVPYSGAMALIVTLAPS